MAYYGHRQVLVVHVLYSMLFGIAVWMSVIVLYCFSTLGRVSSGFRGKKIENGLMEFALFPFVSPTTEPTRRTIGLELETHFHFIASTLR